MTLDSPRPRPPVTWRRPLHAELLYHVLSHLDLGRDAASIYRPRPLRRRRPWVAGLLDAYLPCPGQLTVQVLPLLTPDLEAMLDELRRPTLAALKDGAGISLSARLLEAAAEELPGVERRWRRGENKARRQTELLKPWLGPLLQRLRAALYAGYAEESRRRPPPLTILDAAALAARDGTHGRGLSVRGGRVAAVSLAPARDQVLCHLVHEEIHAVTDAAVRETFAGVEQSTRQGSRGAELHGALERRAVQVGQELLEGHAPRLLASYGAWRRRYGMA